MTIQHELERADPVRATATAAAEAARAATLGDALSAFARAAAEVAGADVVVIRTVEDESLVASAVHASSASLGALVEGSRVPLAVLGRDDGSLHLPVRVGSEIVASVELRRAAAPFDHDERAFAAVVADEVALVMRAFDTPRTGATIAERALLLAADALVASADDERTPLQIARLAAEAAGAKAASIWSADGRLAASIGAAGVDDGALAQAALRALRSREFVTLEQSGDATVATATLGEPALGVLQLVLDGPPALEGLKTFALRAAHVLRVRERSRSSARELDQARALLEVIGRATSRLSRAHTLATAVDGLAALLGIERVAIYLREGDRLVASAGRALAGPHAPVAEALLDLLQGPFRGRGIVLVDELAREPRLADVANAAAEAGIDSAVALPLTVREEAIGLLALYPPSGHEVTTDEQSLLVALAAQLAIAVQNASLHERAQRLADERERALAAERETARRVQALYDVSRSFASSLSLDATLQALARSAVQLLGVDAAVIRMPDPRGDLLTVSALYVADAHLHAPAQTILARPQSLDAGPLRRLFRDRGVLQVDTVVAAELGASYGLLIPFLERGSTAAIVPIATPAEVVATLSLISFDPGKPIGAETLDNALSIAAQAALAIDNGRLYQQQKAFADTIQRALLPRVAPALSGLEIGEVYESSARVDVGGDVYDFLELDDGRLAIVLGDVTGHGIEAAADMAMAKFVFRSLAREHPEPGDFLSSANEVVVGEIAAGKFITMAYLTVAPEDGTVTSASAGHPPPFVVSPDGTVETLPVRGLALGIEHDQTYEEERATLERGGSVVVFTDGVIEARRDDELYGYDRLTQVVSANARLAPRALARAVVDDCRAFADGELSDDCAVVVIRRSA